MSASAEKQTFRDKDTIFREGDKATRAFTILSGKIELTQERENGPERVALLGVGKRLAEEDVKTGFHTATALAVGTVTLRPIEPELPATVGGAGGQPVELTGFLGWLANVLKAPPPRPDALPRRRFSILNFFKQMKKASQKDPSRVEVRIAIAGGDAAGLIGSKLTQPFIDPLGVRAKVIRTPLELPEDTPEEERLSRLHWMAREALVREDADILIVPSLEDDSMAVNVQMFPLGVQDEELVGGFVPGQTVRVPVDLSPPFDQMLLTAALAATVPVNEAKRRTISRTLLDKLETALEVVDTETPALGTRDKALNKIVMANILAQLSAPTGQLEGYRKAADLYGRALEELGEERGTIERATAQRNLGAILPVLAPELEPVTIPAPKQGEEGSEDGEGEEASATIGPMEQAVAHLKEALTVFDIETRPREWAALQNKLGQVFYRMDAADGDEELLKQALDHFKNALLIYTKKDNPFRWGDVMNSIAQTAAILGEQTKTPELLIQAIEACECALEVRRKLETPLQWASTQNNLGSAYFLLAKLTKNEDQLDAAKEAFELARGVYNARGFHRMTIITEKNLTRVIRMKELLNPTEPPRLPWEPEDFYTPEDEIDYEAGQDDPDPVEEAEDAEEEDVTLEFRKSA